jgi:Lon-like ATP-dependent protease
MEKLAHEDLYRFTRLDEQAFAAESSDSRSFMQRFHPRAYQSLNFGLHLKRNQNHIFIMGEPGVGRIGMTKAMLREAAQRKPIPDDVVLVSDFSESKKTQYLTFKAGNGLGFKQAVEELVTQLKSQLPVVFDGHAYQLRNQQLENELAQKQEEALTPALDLADSLDIEVQQNENNFVLYALVGDERLRMADLKKLDKPLREHFMQALDQVEEALNQGLTHFPYLQHEYMEAGRKLNTEVANDHLTPLIDTIKLEFGENQAIRDYLDALQKTVVSKLHLFWDQSSDQVTNNAQSSMEELLAEQSTMSVFEVNLLVDHDGLTHAPVIYEQNATLPKLFGYTINSATANAIDTLTLAMNHQAGLLQKAHGGFLMLNITSVLKDPEIWSHLKAALMSKRLTFEIPSSSSVVPYHLPDFPLDVTLVLVGEAKHFYALQEIDSQFDLLFKVQVEFETELDRTEQHELALAKQLNEEVADWEDLPVSPCAMARLVEYAARLAESQYRMVTNKAILRDLLAEANAYARAHDQTEVTREIIDQTIEQRDFHTGMVEEYYHRAISEEQVLIHVTGRHTGMVNGLTVLTVGRQSFGQPVRITAQASAGDEGVVDIEREIEMAGPIHSKGMLILSGYVRGRYMRHKSWGFSASIVMEQTYDGIEGDSASTPELLALLSSLAQVPLRQDIAVTGSVNQFGDIQPVGGINEKIEGFFKICQSRGLTGQQGVLLPRANAKHLMLSAPVRDAVKAGRFHLYTMAHIDEALDVLTDLPVGQENTPGRFCEGSVNDRVVKALMEMNRKDED